MEYEKLNDNELLFLAADNNEEAINLIIKKYKNIIIKTIIDVGKKYNIIGIDKADLYQEGLIGLITAIETFDKNKDILFYTYASVCVRTTITSEIRRTFRAKHRLLNNSYSLDQLYADNNNLYEIIKDEKNDPDIIMINNENEKELIESIEKLLSANEKEIFELRLKGLSNVEISSLINKDKRFVENTISRIIKKYKDYKNKL